MRREIKREVVVISRLVFWVGKLCSRRRRRWHEKRKKMGEKFSIRIPHMLLIVTPLFMV